MMFFLCTHNSASLGLLPSAPARVHSNIDIDMEGGGGQTSLLQHDSTYMQG